MHDACLVQSGVMHGDQRGMAQAGGDPDLAEEPRLELGVPLDLPAVDDLDRVIDAQRLMPGEIHLARSADADPPQDPISPECGTDR